MKTYVRLLLIGIVISLSFQHSAAYTATDEELARGYVVDSENQTITFVFCQKMWKQYATFVTVHGSFTGPQYSTVMQPIILAKDSQGNFSKEVPMSQIMIPGISGRPEFKFYNGSVPISYTDSRQGIPDGYVFKTEYELNGGKVSYPTMIILDEADLAQAKIDNAKVSTLKTTADFDLTTREGREEISNFRSVPGTKNLFRSYHPIKYSYTHLPTDTEYPRHCILHSLCEEEGIMSDINLSGAESLVPATISLYGEPFTETVPDFYKEILIAGRLINVGAAHGFTATSEDVYYLRWNNSGIDKTLCDRRVRQMLQEIVQFVNSEKSRPPYLLHCHVGQDRTGVMCALLSAICGSSWEEIARDYEKTQRLGNKDFKGRGLLKFSLEQFLSLNPQNPDGNRIEDVADIGAAVRQVMIANGYLTEEDFDNLVLNLNPPVMEGDADGDNSVSMDDIRIIAKVALGIPTPGMVKQNMDLDGDGAFTSTDVTHAIHIANQSAPSDLP